jgi:hypothetical protein
MSPFSHFDRELPQFRNRVFAGLPGPVLIVTGRIGSVPAETGSKNAHFMGHPSRGEARLHGNVDCDAEPETPVVILPARSVQQETKMRNLIIAACCAALMGSISVASAQTTTAPAAAPDAIKADTSTKMKKKSTKKSAMKSGDTMSKDGTKDSK